MPRTLGVRALLHRSTEAIRIGHVEPELGAAHRARCELILHALPARAIGPAERALHSATRPLMTRHESRASVDELLEGAIARSCRLCASRRRFL
jgi:hypothetical protein